MDRRRYVPSGEGLEGRALLSLFGGKTPAPAATTSVQNLPETFKQKEERIQHLPFFLEQLQPGRYLPPDTVAGIQANLSAVTGRLHAPPAKVVDNFNLSLRHGFPYKSLSPDTAKVLNHAFGTVLAAAGADPARAQSLQADLNQLALVDSKGINASYVATNDYALVLQTALAVGRPIPTPAAPTISAKDGARVKNGTAGLTYNHMPAFVGTYVIGASKEKTNSIQIVDESGRVLASGTIDEAGTYNAKVENPLPDGTYKLRARAIDEAGHESNLSPSFRLKVATRVSTTRLVQQNPAVPGGPLGLK